MRSSAGNEAAHAQLLVLAPMFPSINQAWMDRYLEQLLRAGIGFRVASFPTGNSRYHPRVDELGLRDFILTVGENVAWSAKRVARSLAAAPVRTVGRSVEAWQQLAAEPKLKGRTKLAVRAVEAARVVDAVPAVRVVHAHAVDMAYDFLPALRERQLPLVFTFHGLKPTGVPQTPPHRTRAVLEYAHTVLVNTRVSRDEVEALGCDRAKVQIIPQGLPLEQFPFVPRAAPAPGQRLQLLTVGRFDRAKGYEYAMLALRRLLDGGLDAEWHFVGLGDDYEYLVERSTKLRLTEHAIFHAGLEMQALLELYRMCHVFVLPSLRASPGAPWVETQGVVLQEAQASGCIVIGTRVGGIPECMTDGVDGFLIEDRSHRAIANAVQAIVRMPERWAELQRRGRQNVEERFSADVIGAQVAALLRSVMSA